MRFTNSSRIFRRFYAKWYTLIYRIRCTALYKNNDILKILVMTKQIHYQIWFKLDSFSWWSMILVLFSAHHYPSYWNFKIITLMHFLMDACKKWGLSSLLMIRDDCEYRFAKHTSLNSKKSYFICNIYKCILIINILPC